MKNINLQTLGWIIVIVVLLVLLMSQPGFNAGLAQFMHGIYHP